MLAGMQIVPRLALNKIKGQRRQLSMGISLNSLLKSCGRPQLRKFSIHTAINTAEYILS